MAAKAASKTDIAVSAATQDFFAKRVAIQKQQDDLKNEEKGIVDGLLAGIGTSIVTLGDLGHKYRLVKVEAKPRGRKPKVVVTTGSAPVTTFTVDHGPSDGSTEPTADAGKEAEPELTSA